MENEENNIYFDVENWEWRTNDGRKLIDPFKMINGVRYCRVDYLEKMLGKDDIKRLTLGDNAFIKENEQFKQEIMAEIKAEIKEEINKQVKLEVAREINQYKEEKKNCECVRRNTFKINDHTEVIKDV